MIVINNKKQANVFELFLFVLSMSFTPQYLSIDIRLFVYLFWIGLSIFRGGINKKILITKYSKLTFMTLMVLIFYTMFVVLISSTGDHFIYLRYFRSLLALIVIVFYANSVEVNMAKLINSILLVLVFHATIIVGEIINPNLRNYTVIFSGEARRFYQYRANGLVNSYDLAGIYTIIGFLITSLLYLKEKRTKFFFTMMLFMIATVFTSRLNIIFLIIAFLFILRESRKYKVIIFKIMSFMILLVLVILGVGLWAMTTDTFPLMREYVFSKPWANEVYWVVRNTYSDDNILNIITTHYGTGIITAKEFLFGSGVEGNVDPGYSKIFSSIGILGLIIIMMYYLYLYLHLFGSKLKINRDKRSVDYIIINVIFLVIFIGNLKIQYFFSTSLFELFSILILVYETNIINIRHYKGSLIRLKNLGR